MNIRCLFILLALITVNCTPAKDGANQPDVDSENEAAIESPEEVIPTAADSAVAQSIIDGLSIIEKTSNYYFLASLLRYKGDSVSYQKVKTMLGSPENEKFSILALDPNNGYLEYSPNGAEVTYTRVYWRLPNGARLHATTAIDCGPVCNCEIYFSRFENGEYIELNANDVIPPVDELKAILFPDYATSGDPLEFIFNLPQKGKNISFCLEEECLELEWKDGTFELKR